MFQRLMLAVMSVVATGSAIAAQSSTTRPAFTEFEVAAIKPSALDDRSGRFITMRGAHQFVVKNYTLKSLIGAAYNLNSKAIAGGPAWIDADRYDILAATTGPIRPNLDEQMRMLRKLLTDRFDLSFHRERRTLPMYALIVAKNGPKLNRSTALAEAPPALINTIFPDRVLLPARNATIAQFVSMMQRAVLDRPIVDKSGLSGRYDFDLEWAPDETQFGGQGPKEMLEPAKPGLFAALQQQLGLRLEPSKGPVEVLVINQVERPSAN